MAAETIPARLFEQARLTPDRPAYYRRDSGAWRATSWSAYAEQVRRAAAALSVLGLEPGQGLCILAYNRPEWAVAHLAAMAVGAVPTGLYTTAAAPEVEYILQHTEARVLVVESEARYAKVARIRDRLRRSRKHVNPTSRWRENLWIGNPKCPSKTDFHAWWSIFATF